MGMRVKLVCSAYGLTVTDTAALCALYLIWGGKKTFKIVYWQSNTLF